MHPMDLTTSVTLQCQSCHIYDWAQVSNHEDSDKSISLSKHHQKHSSHLIENVSIDIS